MKIIHDEVNAPPCEQWDVLNKEPETCRTMCEEHGRLPVQWYACTREDKHPLPHHAHTLRGCVAVWDDEGDEVKA